MSNKDNVWVEDGKCYHVLVFEAKALALSDYEKRQVNETVILCITDTN